MRAYFIRRLLLVPPTLPGITLIVFFITRIVPGGPLERALTQMQMQSLEGGESSMQTNASSNFALSEDQLDQLKAYYGFGKPWYSAYFS